MNRKILEELEKIKDKPLLVLFNELLLSNRRLKGNLMVRLPENRELHHEDIEYHLQKGIEISRLIHERPLIEIEDYFLSQISILYGTLRPETIDFAREKFNNMRYFRHEFLRETDSELGKIKLSPKNIKRLAKEYEQRNPFGV